MVLGKNEDLFSRNVTVSDINWINPNSLEDSFKCKAKIRYRMEEQPCLVERTGPNTAKITFDGISHIHITFNHFLCCFNQNSHIVLITFLASSNVLGKGIMTSRLSNHISSLTFNTALHSSQKASLYFSE